MPQPAVLRRGNIQLLETRQESRCSDIKICRWEKGGRGEEFPVRAVNHGHGRFIKQCVATASCTSSCAYEKNEEKGRKQERKLSN